MGLDPFTMSPLLALGAVGGGLGVANGASQAATAAKVAKLQNSREELGLAEQRRNQQDALQRTLARQNAGFAASGTDPNSGSALGLARAAETASARTLSLLDADALLRSMAGGAGRKTASAASLLSLGNAGLNTVASIWR